MPTTSTGPTGAVQGLRSRVSTAMLRTGTELAIDQRELEEGIATLPKGGRGLQQRLRGGPAGPLGRLGRALAGVADPPTHLRPPRLTGRPTPAPERTRRSTARKDARAARDGHETRRMGSSTGNVFAGSPPLVVVSSYTLGTEETWGARSDRKPARTSWAKSCGCSHAAK
jgi:hypothetical protein